MPGHLRRMGVHVQRAAAQIRGNGPGLRPHLVEPLVPLTHAACPRPGGAYTSRSSGTSRNPRAG
jgi:hypothetical protein